MPLPIAERPSRTSTASPASNPPWTSTIPTGSRLAAPSRSARAAPASTVTVPWLGLAYFSHSLKLDWRVSWGAKRVPAGSPAQARASTPPTRPLPITVGIPAAEAISAATTLERMPPEPSGEGEWPICSPVSDSGSVTSPTSFASGDVRGSAV